MKRKLIAIFIFLIVGPLLAFAQRPSWDIGKWTSVNDTTHIPKNVGQGYYYTVDGRYYLGMGTYLKLVTDQASGTFTGGTVSGITEFQKGVKMDDSLSIAGRLKVNWVEPYTSSRDTIGFHANPIFFPLGNELYLDGTNDYAYHTDSDSLELNGADGGIAFVIQTSATEDTFISKIDGSGGFYFYTNYQGKGALFLTDGTNTDSIITANAINDDKKHYVAVILDASDYGYIFVDGKYSGSTDISAIGSLDNSANLEIGRLNGGTTYSSGYVDEVRYPLNFGDDGLYATGTRGTDLEIRVGDASGDIIYSEKSPYSPNSPGGLIPAMYRNPGASLSELGYGKLENAIQSNLLTGDMGDFETGIDSEWHIGNATVTSVTDEAQAGTHSAKIEPTSTTARAVIYLSNNGLGITRAAYYEAVAYFYIPSGQTWNGLENICLRTEDIGTTYAFIDTTKKDQWQKVKMLFHISDDIVGRYIEIYCPSDNVGNYFYVDNISLRYLGEVAYWKMNESGTPATLADATDNHLDLTTVGNPTMVHSDYENLALHRIWANTVMADSVTSRRVMTNYLRLPFLPHDMVPSSGDTVPAIYSYGGEVYAHDASGNNTVISPHAGTEWVLNSFNTNTGVRTYINMFDAIKVLQKLSGVKLIYKDSVYVEVPPEKAVKVVYRRVREDSLINTWDAFRYVDGKKKLKKGVHFDSTKNAYYVVLKKVKPFVVLKKGVFKRGKKFYRIKAGVARKPKGYKHPDFSSIGNKTGL